MVHCLAQGHFRHRQEDVESNPLATYRSPLVFSASPSSCLLPSSILPTSFPASSSLSFYPVLHPFTLILSHVVSSTVSSSHLSCPLLSFLSCCLVSFTLPVIFCPLSFYHSAPFLPLSFSSFTPASILPPLLFSVLLSSPHPPSFLSVHLFASSCRLCINSPAYLEHLISVYVHSVQTVWACVFSSDQQLQSTKN